MRQLAEMASIPEGRIRKMVLVLEVDSVPRLYTEGFLDSTEEKLVLTELIVEEKSFVVDLIEMQKSK